jgi:hypothetical protein
MKLLCRNDKRLKGGIQMRNILGILLIVIMFLTACGGEEASPGFSFTVEELEGRIAEALNQTDTGLKIISSEKNEDGRHVIALSDSIMFFVEGEEKVNKVSLAAMSDTALTSQEDLMFAFKLLVGTVDDTLNTGERSSVVNELELNSANLVGHTKAYTNNGIEFSYKGSADDNIVLQAVME